MYGKDKNFKVHQEIKKQAIVRNGC